MSGLQSTGLTETGVSRPGAVYQRILVKALILFILANLVFAWLQPVKAVGRFSAYNHIFPGRVRLPFGENPSQAYNFSLYNLEAMFASHEIANEPKPAGEYRIILIGDSSVWGYLLKPEETLSAHLTAAGMHSPDGRQVRAYNLGYPTFSITKDLLMLEKALEYEPDMIVWLVTLEAFPAKRQLASPIVQNNPQALNTLGQKAGLQFNLQDSSLADPNFIEESIVGRRRELADVLRLQLYGVMWAATGIDQYYPTTYDRPQEDLQAEAAFHGIQPPELMRTDLAFSELEAGVRMAGEIPVLLVNEPMYISRGQNSDIRYNFFYPRWAYDSYLNFFEEYSQTKGWHYADLSTLVPPGEFTNTAVHLSPQGSLLLSQAVQVEILELLEK